MRNCLIIALLLLTGCATHLSQQQCLTTNWQNEGFKDGSAGTPPRDLSQAAIDCTHYNIGIDYQQYSLGWQQGAKIYCSPDINTGYADGFAGKPANIIYDRMPICLIAKTKLNLMSYNMGRQKGIRALCTYENGMNKARQREMIPAEMCPPQLRARFSAGWNAGKELFCNQAENGFALGKAGQAYPAMCSENIYVAFKSEYDRGHTIHDKLQDLHNKENQVDLGPYGSYEQRTQEKESLDSQILNLEVLK